MIDSVIFDLDGTLLDTLSDLAISVNHALSEFNMPNRTIDEIRNFIGNGVRVLIKRAVPADTDEKTYEKCFSVFSQYYLEHMTDNTKIYNGIIDLLNYLKKNNIKSAVVSNKLHKAVNELCDDYFGDLITASFGVAIEEERKPAPVNVFKAIDVLKTKPENVLYIGDSEVDIQTANNAKIKCIGVSWGFRNSQFLKDNGCEIVINKPLELINYL